MSRNKKRIYIGIFLVLASTGGIYLFSPLILSSWIKSQLNEYGMTNVNVDVGYPSVNSIELNSISFAGPINVNHMQAVIPSIRIEYNLPDLLAGQIEQIHINEINLKLTENKSSATKQDTNEAMPVPFALLTGQWLSEFPVGHLTVDKLRLDATIDDKTTYHLTLNTQIKSKYAQLVGDIFLPGVKTPLTFLAGTSHTGQAHVHLLTNIQGDDPLLLFEVLPPQDKEELSNSEAANQVRLDGNLHTRLQRVLPATYPVLASFYPEIKSFIRLKGELSSQWQAHITDNQWEVSGKAKMTSIGGKWEGHIIPKSNWAGNFHITKNQVKSDSVFKSFNNKIKINSYLQHNFKSGKGISELTLIPVHFGKDKLKLSDFGVIKDFAFPVKITNGQVSANMKLNWNKHLTINTKIHLQDFNGQYNDMPFENLQSILELAQINGVRSIKPISLKVHKFDVGFPISNISSEILLKKNSDGEFAIVHVNNFEAYMLGGRAHAQDFDFDTLADKNSFVVQFKGLGLRYLLELERQEGLYGDGQLDGQIPIEINKGEILIHEGKLTARKPGGVIKYSPTVDVAELAKSNPSVGMMLQALSNFKYDVLDVTTQYKPGGDLDLKLRLQGQNPQWQNGQPINLNLNVQENIPALLRSLQLSGEISEKLKKRILNKSK